MSDKPTLFALTYSDGEFASVYATYERAEQAQLRIRRMYGDELDITPVKGRNPDYRIAQAMLKH